jgi:hypothetical protein
VSVDHELDWARHESGGSVVSVLLLVGACAASGVVGWTFVEPTRLPLGPAVVVPAALLLLVGSVNVVHRLPHHNRRIPLRVLAPVFRTGVGAALDVLALAGLAAAVTGLAMGGPGRPGASRVGCPYPLESRGRVVACATPAEYRVTALGDERFAAGLVLVAFAVQLAVAVAPRELAPAGRL